MKLVVTFECTSLENFHDKMTIVSDLDFKKEIELHAYAPQASVIFEPVLNFGFVKMGLEGE